MRIFFGAGICLLLSNAATPQTPETTHNPHQRLNFDAGWKFRLGDDPAANAPAFNDKPWRSLDLPHDWSIEGNFSQNNSTGQQEGGLPGGIGWYRKTFQLQPGGNRVFITFDGIYRNSEVWINGHLLGKRPNGYISFRYELTSWLKKGADNVLAIRVDNSAQPNSRWYTGSGIYRHVWLETVPVAPIAIDHWGIRVSTVDSSDRKARLYVATTLRATKPGQPATLQQILYDANGVKINTNTNPFTAKDTLSTVPQYISVSNPQRWFPDHPYLYTLETSLFVAGRLVDRQLTRVGIRQFQFDRRQGFLLNGRHYEIEGVCLHHDLGALGAAVNTSAIRRQLQILKDMGCNAIRTAHNPPAPEFLDCCDEMGFLVMDEAFDMWAKKKNKYDYSFDFVQWHRRDLEDQVKRDRNHPSVIIWSIGNEIPEQASDSGSTLARELSAIVRANDPTRPVTSALTEPDTLENTIYQAGALDVMGLNYNQQYYSQAKQLYPGYSFLATETTSALETRGHYDMPADSVRHWPTSAKIPAVGVNRDYTVSSYDNVCAYWGSTHEETWRIVKQYPNVAGLFVWSGFDYLGEPTPYKWPARSSYFGIVDLAGFPKDIYYMYQAEWSSKPVLHLLPHWNWKPGQLVDVWAYFNEASEVELFLNGQSLGVRKKSYDDLHVQWQVPFEPGTLKAVSRLYGRPVMETEIHTAGAPARIQLEADRQSIQADGSDLAFVTMRIVDADGNVVPDADTELSVNITGEGILAGMDNGYQADLSSFRGNRHNAFNGLCLAIVQAKKKAGRITLHVSGAGLPAASLDIESR